MLSQGRGDWLERGNRPRALVYWLLVGWLLVSAAVIVFQGLPIGSFNLSDSVINVFVGSNTVAVIGIFVKVASNLFR